MGRQVQVGPIVAFRLFGRRQRDVQQGHIGCGGNLAGRIDHGLVKTLVSGIAFRIAQLGLSGHFLQLHERNVQPGGIDMRAAASLIVGFLS